MLKFLFQVFTDFVRKQDRRYSDLKALVKRSKILILFKNTKQVQKLGRNPRSDRDLCEKGNKSPEKK